MLFVLGVFSSPPPRRLRKRISPVTHTRRCTISMTLENSDLNMSRLSLNSSSSQSEDWDRSLILEDNEPPTTSSINEDAATTSESMSSSTSTMTPRNSVAFPAESEGTPRRHARESSGGYTLAGKGKRSLSELMRLHAEKGTDCKFSPEEASRVADVLGQWVRAILLRSSIPSCIPRWSKRFVCSFITFVIDQCVFVSI